MGTICISNNHNSEFPKPSLNNAKGMEYLKRKSRKSRSGELGNSMSVAASPVIAHKFIFKQNEFLYLTSFLKHK